MKCNIHLFVAILENGHHIEFLIGESYIMDLITIEMSYVKFGDCITICTIRPTNAYYLLHSKCYNLPQGKCYNMAQCHLAHEMCNCRKIYVPYCI